MTRTLTHHTLSRKSVLGAACALLVACGPESGDAGSQAPDRVGDTTFQLTRAESCDDLLARIQSSFIAQLELRAEQLREADGSSYGPGIEIGGVVEQDVAPPRDASGEVPTGAPLPSDDGASDVPAPTPSLPGAGSAGSDDGANGANGANGGGANGGFSQTTVQVEDVDEADIVKTDGDRIYLLHGGTLFVLQGWPAAATQILGSTLIEGQPAEMFVSAGKAIVFSRIYRDVAEDAGADTAGYGSGYTKISVLDVSDAAPRVLRESFVEGDYASARRHGDRVRAVIQDGFKIPRLDAPAIEYRDAFGRPFPQSDIDAQVDAWLTRTTRSLRATDLGDWLPRELTQQGESVVAVAPRCADYYSPDPGLTENGVTSVVALDLADVSAPLDGATILGRAERVYANDSVLLVTQTDYRYTYDAGATEQTIIHRFDIGDGDTTYGASGAVAGRINDQFSLDERDGIIRVSTTETPAGGFGRALPGDVATAPTATAGNTAPAGKATPASDIAPADEAPAQPVPVDPPIVQTAPPPVAPQNPVSVSRVVTLRTNGDRLEAIGATPDFGADERIFATRFIGDRGYVVTFRQTDPLFVIDLSEPTDPHVVGELHIPGFSNYLFPLDDDHLFAVGQDATPEGFTQGLALQVFDVSDPARPALAAKYVYPDAGDSPANVDHRAISFHPDRNVVALPHRSYVTGESTLDVFRVEATGVTPLGDVVMASDIDPDVCLTRYFGPLPEPELDALRAQLAENPDWQRDVLASCHYGNTFRRGLFRDDFVYGISNTGVFVYDMTAMNAGAVGTLALPAEVYAGVNYAGGGAAPPDMSPPAGVDVPASGGAGGGSSAGMGASAGGSPGSAE